MIPFDYQPRTRIVFGTDTIHRLGELARQFNTRRALVISDPGIVSVGHTQVGVDALTDVGIETVVHDGVHENPTTLDVNAALAVASDFCPDLLVGLGGGSSMDCAKGVNFLYTNGGEMRDYWGVDKATKDLLPMIAVPTTAGTGSETQSFALIADAETHMKMACGDKKAACRVALLDPKLTLTQPLRVTALTGVDALAHAIESYVTRRRNALSLAYSREAWLLIADNFVRVLEDSNDLDSRAGMQLGSCFAGLAIENSMLGAAHALANPLTALYGVAHGEAVGMMLPHVIRFNGVDHDRWYHELLDLKAGSNGAVGRVGGATELADFVVALLEKAGLAGNLEACGVKEDRLVDLAKCAAQQWTGTFNPRKMDQTAFLQLYRAAI